MVIKASAWYKWWCSVKLRACLSLMLHEVLHDASQRKWSCTRYDWLSSQLRCELKTGMISVFVTEVDERILKNHVLWSLTHPCNAKHGIPYVMKNAQLECM